MTVIPTVPEPTRSGGDAATLGDGPSTIAWDGASRRSHWPLVAIATGITGLAANLLSLGDATARDEPDPYSVVEGLARGTYHAAFVLGLATTGGLVVVSSSLRAWFARRRVIRLAARVVPDALMITAALGVIAACTAGSLALYLPGGADEGTMWTEGLLAAYLYLDFGALVGWWGATLAAAFAIPLAFGAERLLPRWFGVVSVPLVAVPLLVAAVTGLPGLPGLAMPIWLVVLGASLVGGAD